MASIYTTITGDTWDLIAWKQLGSERYMGALIEANYPYAEVLRFDAGIKITIPDIPEETPDDLPFWHSDDDNTIWAEEAD